MRKLVLLVVLMLIFSALWIVAADNLPEGQQVKVYIQNKTFKGELLSVTQELIVILVREKDKERKTVKETVLGCFTLETEIVKVQKRCGPIGNIFTKGRKFTFKKNTPAKINENIINLSYDALYGSLIPEHIKGRMKNLRSWLTGEISQYGNSHTVNKFLLWGIQFFIILLALFVHEKAHAWMARRCGDRQVNIQDEDVFKVFRHIDWIGSVCVPIFMIWRSLPVCAWSKPVLLNPLDVHDHRRDTIYIVASGPAANMLLGAAGIVVFTALKAAGLLTSALLGMALYYLTRINFTLAVFNLLPIPPLDGSVVLEVFLRNDALSAFEDIKPYGFIFLLAAIYFHMLDFIVQPITTLVVSIYGL